MSPLLRSSAFFALLALLPRLVIAGWGFSRFPPTDDGTFYDILARRIADGHGYTWLWPDGVVTPTAHYPVGYPAALGLAYRLFGPHPGLAMLLGAGLAALATAVLHGSLKSSLGYRGSAAAALVFALHPALISYTPALMTEGVTASLYALALAAFIQMLGTPAARGRALWGLCTALVIAAATYVRPQSIVLGPFLALGYLLGGRLERGRLLRTLGIAVALGLGAAACVLPWTIRNCNQMGTCGFVSYNGGWNLLIATNPEARGVWAEIVVPSECTTVFDEAKKDACFGQAARRAIHSDPIGFLALAPLKLAATFDYLGAGPYYLHRSNPAAFGARAKIVLGVGELVLHRALLVASLYLLLPLRARRSRWLRVALAVVLAAVGWIGVIAVAAFGVAEARRRSAAIGGVLGAAAAVVFATVLVHVVFFGAGRYGLVVVPAIAVLFGCGVAAALGETSGGAPDTLTNPR